MILSLSLSVCMSRSFLTFSLSLGASNFFQSSAMCIMKMRNKIASHNYHDSALKTELNYIFHRFLKELEAYDDEDDDDGDEDNNNACKNKGLKQDFLF